MEATMTAPTRRDYTKVGERFDREKFEAAAANLTWVSPPPAELAMIPALGISKAIEELRIPKVSALASDGMFEEPDGEEMAYYSVYGIEGNYKNARVRILIADTGTELIPVAMDVWEGR